MKITFNGQIKISMFVVTQQSYKRAKMALHHSPDYQTSFESTGLSVQEKFNIDFQDGCQPGFPIRKILANFDLFFFFFFFFF